MEPMTLRRIVASERAPGPPTAGLTREEAVATEKMWAGYAKTDPGLVSDWHHHGEYESAIYVLWGVLRVEFGPGGAETFDAGPGDFVFVPAGAIHRESNPSDEPTDIVVVRAGSGASVVNVDGPAPS
jgi:uncharacterized RmlC-like cupin family protein